MDDRDGLELVLPFGQDLDGDGAPGEVHGDHPAARRSLVGPEEEPAVHLVHEAHVVEEAGEHGHEGRAREGEVAHVDLGLAARAPRRGEHEVAPVARHGCGGEELLVLGTLVDELVLVLRPAQAVVVDLAEVVLVTGRHRARLREARVVEALVARGPGDPGELRPLHAIVQVPRRPHVANEDLLAIAPAPRDRVGEEAAVPRGRGQGEGYRSVGGQGVGVEEDAFRSALAHEQDRLVLEARVPEIEVASAPTLGHGEAGIVVELRETIPERIAGRSVHEFAEKRSFLLHPADGLREVGVLQPAVGIGDARAVVVVHDVREPGLRVEEGQGSGVGEGAEGRTGGSSAKTTRAR